MKYYLIVLTAAFVILSCEKTDNRKKFNWRNVTEITEAKFLDEYEYYEKKEIEADDFVKYTFEDNNFVVFKDGIYAASGYGKIE